MRTLLPFDRIEIGFAIQLFKSEYDMEIMPFPDFVHYIETLFKKANIEISNKSLVKEAATYIFSVIDNNSNGTLDITELAIGLSLICGGTPVNNKLLLYKFAKSALIRRLRKSELLLSCTTETTAMVLISRNS